MAKYMIQWSISPEHYAAALDRFETTGAPPAEGVELLGRWHEPGSQRGFILMEAQDPAAIARHLGPWNDLVRHRIAPVIEDEDVPAHG